MLEVVQSALSVGVLGGKVFCATLTVSRHRHVAHSLAQVFASLKSGSDCYRLAQSSDRLIAAYVALTSAKSTPLRFDLPSSSAYMQQ